MMMRDKPVQVAAGGSSSGSSGTRGTMAAHLAAIIREHGYRGLFRGLTVNYIKVVPATAIGFTTYEQLKVALALENHI